MLITKPDYFNRFQCIADSCPDSCCKEWDVQVDETAAAYYRSLTGDLGNRLREVLHTENGETVMTIIDGRCPMWRADGLCRIQAELGEAALCKTCREFPRLTHDYGDFVELQLELSCPEAAKYILSLGKPTTVTEAADGGNAEYDEDAMALLKVTRERALELLFDDSRSVPEALALMLLFGYQAQSQLDGEESQDFAADSALESVRDFLKTGNPQEITDFFLSLEILTPEWKALLESHCPAAWSDHHRALAAYLVQRYWLHAVSDYDLYCRVKFIIISCLVICSLGGNFVDTAQLYSTEIENSWENVDAILEGAYCDPIFTDDKLLGLLLFHK